MSGSTVTVKAGTTHAAVAADPGLKKAIPALSKLAGGIGDPHVRNRGTIGGSIANADPAADYPSAVVGLGATVHTDQRKIAGDKFFTGMFETALKPDEIVTAVEFPVPKRSAYVKFPNPGLALCDGRRVRCRACGWQRARRGDRCWPECVPCAGDGKGAGKELLRRCDLGRQGQGRRS